MFCRCPLAKTLQIFNVIRVSGDPQTISLIPPGQFRPENHFYPKVMGKNLHPTVRDFFQHDVGSLLNAYLKCHPAADAEAVESVLFYRPQHLNWAGIDMFKVETVSGEECLVVIETNSCPAGQKSMPPVVDGDFAHGYRRHLQNVVLPHLANKDLPAGALAVLYDKNIMENSGYAAALADLTDESVFLVSCRDGESPGHLRFHNDVLEIFYGECWLPIRLALRYVTERPWNRLPLYSRTRIVNPIVACLAGGRNKQLAAMAYEMFNTDFSAQGCRILTPVTHVNVSLRDVADVVRLCGGLAVIKEPYSNAGRAVYVVTRPQELETFLHRDFVYDQFVVQRLVGHREWRKNPAPEDLFHTGLRADENGNVFIADVRVMLCATPEGYRPQIFYSRCASQPLKANLSKADTAWPMLGTNLSYLSRQGRWLTDDRRLLLFDENDFEKLGWSRQDLVEAFFQALFSAVAIDRMACRLVGVDGSFDKHLFQALNRDDALLGELML